MRIAVFVSHPTQHLAPLWRELAKLPEVKLKVFYYSRQGVETSFDRDFGIRMAWDVDLLAGYDHEFLPRQWPTRDPLNYRPNGLNKNLVASLRQGWDVAYVAGYVHLNNWLIALACRRMGIPLLCQGDTSFITALEHSRSLLAIKRLVLPRYYRMASGCLAAGDHGRAYFLYYGADHNRVFFCPIPVDVDRFRQSAETATPQEKTALKDKYGIPHDKKIVLFSGKFMSIKNPLDLAAALHRLNRDDVIGVFAGDGKLRPQIEQQAGKRLITTGFVNQNEIPLLTSLATILVMPSSRDNHPLSVTEALAVGVPVVLSDRCGCYGPNDVFRDGEDGLLYPCGDIEQLTSKIAYLLDNDEVRQRMAQRGRELAETQSLASGVRRFIEAARTVSGGIGVQSFAAKRTPT